MSFRTRNLVFFFLIGLICNISTAQDLVTECWSNDWTKYLEKCYLVVTYQHSWAKANDYCSKYGARLAETAGITVNDHVASLATTEGLSEFWIGYNLIGISPSESYKGKWADGRSTSVKVGDWAPDQPDPESGRCAYVKASGAGNQWYIADCERVMPFVCEMDPCPQGMFQCSGRCLYAGRTCDGKNDCGDNRDELNCTSSCTFSDSGSTGVVQHDQYLPNENCQWTIETTPGTQIIVQVENFETEANTDFLEIWDGGLTLASSTLMSRLSGTFDQMTFTSSYNFLILRFVSDASVQKKGFKITWDTEIDCTNAYKTIHSRTFTNTEIQEGPDTLLGSKQTFEDCKPICEDSVTCYGFAYIEQPTGAHLCRFFKGLPILASDDSSAIHMKMCPPGTSTTASLPVPATSFTAVPEKQQIASPSYPLPYIGNTELEYTITTEGNNLITLEVLDVELCCKDTIMIYDGTPTSHTLLDTLNSDSKPHLIISTSRNVFIRATLNNHWKCRGFLMTINQGCDNTMTETGIVSSPGYGTQVGYPGVMVCTWTLRAPSKDRSITLVFEEFDLQQDMDFLTIQPAGGSTMTYTGTELQTENSVTADNYMVLTLTTSGTQSGTGFKASFSPGCSSLKSEGVVLDTNSYNYLDVVTMSCDVGYYLTGDFEDQTEVTVTCSAGGAWNKSPKCARGYCGPPPLIHNGYIVFSTGVQGNNTAKYKCNSGFSSNASMEIKCHANHMWDPPPDCTSGVCPSITSVTSDVMSDIAHGDGTQFGSVVKLSCSEYTEIHGAATVQCVDGLWDFVNGKPSICHSKPCPTPVISNAYLSPAPHYVLNQGITVSCKYGHELVGDSMINCGVSVDLPRCEVKQCHLNFENVIPVDESDVTVYDYGNSVTVKCISGYELTNFKTSALKLTCLNNGQWNNQPICSEISCGIPQDVKGSIYSPLVPCLAKGCEFVFSCSNKYQREGTSSSGNDDRVRCGATFDGRWDFGDLRCSGAQCKDPTYSASGFLKVTQKTSFQEGSTVEFGCDRSGYSPVPAGGITCRYNATSDEMEWDGPLPVCVDTTPPEINHCPTSPVTVTNMQPPGFIEPYATDNTFVKSFTVTPSNYQNFHPDQPVNRAMTLTYTAEDFEGLTSTCRVSIVIPGYISCRNSDSLNYLVRTDETIDSQRIAQDFVINRDPTNLLLHYTPTSPSIEVTQSSDMLSRIDEVEVVATDKEQNFVEKCRLQFRYRGYMCNSWGINIPGGGGLSCVDDSCYAYCNDDTFFMENPQVSSFQLTCTVDKEEGVWNRAPPVCAWASSEKVVFTSIFDYKYSISGNVDEWYTCADIYRQQLEAAYQTLKTDLENLCTAKSPTNPISLTVRDMTQASLSYSHDLLSVRFEVIIHLMDETADNALTVKDNCTYHIQTAFNTKSSAINSILTLTGKPTIPVSCGSGSYMDFYGTPMYSYECTGDRKLHYVKRNNVNVPVCLSCPLGYFMEANNCSPCPDGTYGWMSADGPACQDCPGKIGPGMTALTSETQCTTPGICPPGSYSEDGLTPCTMCPKNFYALSPASQSCSVCPSNKITTSAGASSESQCKTLDELGNEESPCNPNPCENDGVCSFQRSDFFCTCKQGYTGRKCQSDFNACSSKPCQNYHKCTPGENNDFTCACSAEYEGKLCEIDVSTDCENTNLCQNNGTCHNRRGSYICVCPTSGGFSNADGSCSTPIDQCLENPCVEGDCNANGNYYRTCDCYPGFTGVDCDTNIDDCAPNPCVNGGKCVDGVDSFTCICGSDFYGDFCQFGKACNRSCDVFRSVCNSCNQDNTAECENYGNSYICHCKDGFTGTDCEIEDTECRSYPCQHGGLCVVVQEDPGYLCECSVPWTGPNCEKEETHCPDGQTCHNEGTCFSTYSGFQCSCTSDFIGRTCNVSYDLCGRVKACVGDDSECSYTEADGFQCVCGQGLSGESCQVPAPVCSSDYCLNGGTCSVTSGVLECSCKTGYAGPKCETNINDCEPNPCGVNQQCIDMVNTYACACDNGKRGEQCDKDVGNDFDYIIEAPDDCRLNDNIASFGDGSTPFNELSVAFWCRYTRNVGQGTIMNIYGVAAGASERPDNPDFHWSFDALGVTVDVKDTARRKKRSTPSSRSYTVDIADGYWHHIVVTWSTKQLIQELTIYVDGLYRNQLVETLPSASSHSFQTGFLVVGSYNTATRTGDSENSFKGRLSRLYILGVALDEGMVEQLYGQSLNPPEAALLLHQESNLMLQYMVDYNSEITLNKCMSSVDTYCEGLYSESNLPEVNNCEDVLIVTERTAAAAWSLPSFTNTEADTRQTNMPSGAAALDWGVYGVSFAEFDQNQEAVVCSFRLYNYPVNCTSISGGTSSNDISCTTTDGDQRCEGSCDSGSQLTGPNSVFKTCSKHLMWNKAFGQEPYNFPTCAEKQGIKFKTTLTLSVNVKNINCEQIKNDYNNNYLGLFNTFNSNYGNQLCKNSLCTSLLRNTFTCDGHSRGTIIIDFGLLPDTVSSSSQVVSPVEALKMAVADENVFNYEDSVSGLIVMPDWNSLEIDVKPACDPGYQVSDSACVLCGSGTFYNEETSLCQRCPKGEYRNILDDKETPTSLCNKCTGSKTTASDGSPDESYCKANCLSGRYYNDAAGDCVDCKIGFYQPERGQFSCIACSSDKTTDSTGKKSSEDCVSPESISTTSTAAPATPQPGASVGAATESGGPSTGVIVAIVLGVIIGLLIIVLVVCLLCYKCQVPCFAKKTQEVAPEVKEKDRYFANKYGERYMKFVNYNLPNIQEKKARPQDKEPFVEPPLSEESGSIKNDISIHVPVFLEKLDGSVSKKHMYISNNLNVKSPTPRVPLTSSPRANIYHDIDFSDERKHKKKRRKKSRKPAEFDGAKPVENGQIPKALAPLPQKLKSVPPDAIHIRPSSALERPRETVEPSHYENFLPRESTERGLRPTSDRELMATTSSDPDIILGLTSSEREMPLATSTERGSRQTPDREDLGYPMKTIVVESDPEDLR